MKAMTMKEMAAAITPHEMRLQFFRGYRTKRFHPSDRPKRKPETPIPLEPTFIALIIRHSLPQQLAFILLTLISFPFLYFSLDLHKTIGNRAIVGKQRSQNIFWYNFSQVNSLLFML